MRAYQRDKGVVLHPNGTVLRQTSAGQNDLQNIIRLGILLIRGAADQDHLKVRGEADQATSTSSTWSLDSIIIIVGISDSRQVRMISESN